MLSSDANSPPFPLFFWGAGRKLSTEGQAPQGDPEAFAELTEAADTLQDEMDIYECTREQLVKEAGGLPSSTAAPDDGTDMFADSDEDEAINVGDVPSVTALTQAQAMNGTGANQHEFILL